MTKKMMCDYYDCEEKPSYCYLHFRKYKNKAYKRGVWIVIILLIIISIATILPYLLLSVNEIEFCEKKIEENFPESYNIEGKKRIIYNDELHSCIIEYKPSQEEKFIQKDGLKYIQNSQISDTPTKELIFKLTEKEDIDYLARDDFGFIVNFGLISLFFAGFLLKEEILKW